MEQNVERAPKRLVGELVAVRTWGRAGNPNRYRHVFERLSTVNRMTDGSWSFQWEGGRTARLRRGTIVVLAQESDASRIRVVEGDADYVTFWDGEENEKDPTVDAWLYNRSVAGVFDSSLDRLVGNGVSLSQARAAIAEVRRPGRGAKLYAPVVSLCAEWGDKEIDSTNAAEVAAWWDMKGTEGFGDVTDEGPRDPDRFIEAVRAELDKLSSDFYEDVPQMRVLTGLLAWARKEKEL